MTTASAARGHLLAHRPVPGWAGGLVCLALGASMPLAFAPFDAYPIAPLSLGMAALLWRLPSVRQAFLWGWLFGLGQFGAGVHWVYFSLHDYGQASPFFAGLVTLLLVVYLAVFPGLVAALTARARLGPVSSVLLLMPGLWVFGEWLRERLFTGFPWLALGYSQTDSPLAGWAPLVGIHGLGLLTALTAGAVALFALGRGLRRWGALALIVLIVAVGLGLEGRRWTQPSGPAFSVSLVQGNIRQDLKWRPEWRKKSLDRYVELTFGTAESDLIVWPETALPFYVDQLGEFGEQLAERLTARGSLLLTGAPVQHEGVPYNSLVAFGSATGVYHKRHLVPFGEYVPLRGLLDVFNDYVQIPMSDFGRGADRQQALRLGDVRLGASICYEIVFPDQIRASLPQAGVLVNVSNDAWFGDSLAPHQHLQIARLRALESGRYLLRGTNNGISAIIDPLGTIVDRTAQFEAATLTGEAIPHTGLTPYGRWGSWPALSTAAVLVLLAGMGARRRASGRA